MNYWKKWSAIILIPVLIQVNAFAQTQSFTMIQAQEYGVQNNTDAKRALLDIEAGESTKKSTTSMGLPQVDFGLDYTHYLTLPTQLIPAEFFGGEPGQFEELQFGTPENMNVNFSASQLLFSGPYIYGLQAAKVYIELLQYQSKVTESDIRKNVELAYFNVLILDEQARLLEKDIAIIEKTLFEMSEMYKQGFVEEVDVDRLRITNSNLQTMEKNLVRQKEVAKNLLKFQMGMDLSEEINLTDSLTTIQDNFILMENDQNYLTRPEFDVAQTNVDLNALNIKVNKAAYFPTLALYGSYSQVAQRNQFNFLEWDNPWFETSLVGVKLSLPIFDGLNRSAAVQEATIGLNRAQLTQLDVTRGIQLEISQYTSEYLNAQEELENQISNMELANKIYSRALTKYKEGVGSSLELTDGETTVFNAQRSYINALYNLLSSRTNLKKSLGYL